MRYDQLHDLVTGLKLQTLQLQIYGQLNQAVACETLADTGPIGERSTWLRSMAFARRRAAQLDRQRQQLI